MARKKTKKEKLKSSKRKSLQTQIDPQKYTYSFKESDSIETEKVVVKKPISKTLGKTLKNQLWQN